MEIESVTVIPMSKESKWEDDESQSFEVYGITTDYVTWFTQFMDVADPKTGFELFDDDCRAFAKKQNAFMITPTALFGKTTFAAKSRLSYTLDGLVLDGPLYRIFAIEDFDETAEKSVEQTYIDPVTFQTKTGLWYPKKKIYKIIYGVEL